MNNIFISTSTYAEYSQTPIDLLEQNQFFILRNNYGRKLKKDELLEMAHNSVGIIAGTEKYSIDILSKFPYLKVISRLGVGLDNIDMDAAIERDIKVYKTTTTPAPAVAELVLGLMIDLSRKISQSDHLLKNGIWKKQMGNQLWGKTVGIIGLGVIGKQLVKLLRGFEFNILAFDKHLDNSFAKNNNINYCSLEELLKNSNIVTIHLNLSKETKLLIDQEKIELMKPESILINTSRGEIIDEDSLYNALKNNHLSGAGLDVFEHEPYSGRLINLDNVTLTPHIGGYAKEIRKQMEIEAAENLIRGLNEKQ